MKLALVVASILAIPTIAGATPTTYTVDNSFSTFTVSGTITTDGTIGTLGTSDIIAYTLNVTGPTKSDTLTQVNSSETIAGTGVTATSSGLFYNYVPGESQSTYDYLGFFGSDFTDLCYQSSGCDTFGSPHESIFIRFGGSSTEPLSGNLEIASAAGTTVTPEPASFVLLGTGLFGIVGAGRRRFLR